MKGVPERCQGSNEGDLRDGYREREGRVEAKRALPAVAVVGSSEAAAVAAVAFVAGAAARCCLTLGGSGGWAFYCCRRVCSWVMWREEWSWYWY